MIPLSDLPYLEWADPDTGGLTRLYADVVKSESINLPAIVTKHPVESGANITDHYRKDLETVSLTMYFSGSPIRGDLDTDFPGSFQDKKLTYRPSPRAGAPLYTPGGLAQAATGAISGLLGTGPAEPPKSMSVLAFDTPPKRLQKVLELVRTLQTKGILLTVKTTSGILESCGITHAAITRAAEHNDGGDVELELQQVITASSDIAVALPLPAEPRAIPKKSAGAGGGADVDPNSNQASVLKKLLNGAGATVGGSGL